MFRNVRKHAASTSSVGNRNGGGGGDYLGYLPHYVDDECKLPTPVYAYEENGEIIKLCLKLFGNYSENDVITAKVGNIGFENADNQIEVIDDSFIERAEEAINQMQQQGCNLYNELLDYIKHYKGKTEVTVYVSADSVIPTPEYCDIYLNGELLYSNLAVSTRADAECCL